MKHIASFVLIFLFIDDIPRKCLRLAVIYFVFRGNLFSWIKIQFSSEFTFGDDEF